mmetsp:Transcript_85728/g.239673  ORF Transcript_85728/g.239673 Transcript_85728/m.239673 type:complete len:234 (+) Transcript_85728:743-1444(+)
MFNKEHNWMATNLFQAVDGSGSVTSGNGAQKTMPAVPSGANSKQSANVPRYPSRPARIMVWASQKRNVPPRYLNCLRSPNNMTGVLTTIAKKSTGKNHSHAGSSLNTALSKVQYRNKYTNKFLGTSPAEILTLYTTFPVPSSTFMHVSIQSRSLIHFQGGIRTQEHATNGRSSRTARRWTVVRSDAGLLSPWARPEIWKNRGIPSCSATHLKDMSCCFWCSHHTPTQSNAWTT